MLRFTAAMSSVATSKEQMQPLTVKILDRPNGPQPGDDLSAMRVLASKEIKVTVQPLTQTEIDAEIALMAKVKAAYWDGIRNANTDQNNVTTDLHAFQECYLNDNGELTWVYDYKELKNHGIIPDELDNWYDLQIWRLFRSSNADVIAHENLLVTRQGDSKAVTITSYLSSETLGKYAEKYPQNADFQKLYQQPVTVDLVVTGTQYAQGNNESRVQAAFSRLSEGKTVIMIAHRLSTVTNVDQIFVICDGRVAECGNSRELLAKDGIFSRMWKNYQTSVQWKVTKEVQ